MTYLALTQCKRLKALGFPQHTRECWSDFYDPGVQFVIRSNDRYATKGNCIAYCLPIVEDLLEWIGGSIQLQSSLSSRGSSSLRWTAIYHPGQPDERKAADAASAIKALYNLAVTLKQA